MKIQQKPVLFGFQGREKAKCVWFQKQRQASLQEKETKGRVPFCLAQEAQKRDLVYYVWFKEKKKIKWYKKRQVAGQNKKEEEQGSCLWPLIQMVPQDGRLGQKKKTKRVGCMCSSFCQRLKSKAKKTQEASDVLNVQALGISGPTVRISSREKGRPTMRLSVMSLKKKKLLL